MDDAVAPDVAALVRRRWPGATLAALAPLAGDFSTRRYLRARLTGGGAPATAVVMVLAGSGLPLSSEELGVLPTPPRELPFLDVHRLLTAIGAPVPALYLADVAAGVLLIEDGGDVLLWDRVGAAPGDAEALYQRAIDALLVIHTRGTAHADRTSIAFAQRFDARLYRWELEHFLEYGVERRLGRRLDERARGAWHAAFDALSTELALGELVLSHRDYHSWNILMRGTAPLIIDFQDALLAAPEYDLASLLTDRITPRVVSPDVEARLLDYYWRARGLVGDEDRTRRYRLTALHRALKVIGRIHYVAIEKQKRAPLEFFPDLVATVRRLFAVVQVPGDLAARFEALPWPEAARPGAVPAS
jgi:aminoglycoside/choline kinase family phosphotransferase